MSRLTSLTSVSVEIVELIASWLTIDLSTDHPYTRDFISYEYEDRRESQKRDCKAMRLVCQAFAQLHAINKSLFSIHHLYPDPKSLQCFDKLSEHSSLRKLVKHVVFMHPQFPETSIDLVTYERQLCHWLTIAYSEKLDDSKWKCMDGFNGWYKDLPLDAADLERSPTIPTERDPDDIFGHPHAFHLAKKYFDSVFPAQKRMQLHAEIQEITLKQQQLLDEGIYTQHGARSFARLPNATSISICGGNGALAGTVLGSVGGMNSSFLQKRYPQLGLCDVHTYDTNPITREKFLPVVQELLALSEVSLTHLYLTQMVELSPSHSLVPSLTPKTFSRLRVAHLILKDQGSMTWTADSWDKSIMPVLKYSSSSLKDLHLQKIATFRFGTPDEIPHATLDPVLELCLPSVQRITVIGEFGMKAEVLTNFLTRHPRLKTFSMSVEEKVPRTNAWWRLVYKALRTHPGLMVKTLKWSFPGDYHYCCSFTERENLPSSKNPPQWYRDLSHYLYGKSAWTLALEERFGRMEGR